ncbi:hypothetical protein WN48_00249 [Eufriesea mexicana]|uniref:Uncharacterized protein n=1 Tax=Eufriesea mexicana TaxID=516756 RepID=A0A310SD73_9HYME|nr:hypothetical protein WN48_00249 [Eufriesea mexicana]
MPVTTPGVFPLERRRHTHVHTCILVSSFLVSPDGKHIRHEMDGCSVSDNEVLTLNQ